MKPPLSGHLHHQPKVWIFSASHPALLEGPLDPMLEGSSGAEGDITCTHSTLCVGNTVAFLRRFRQPSHSRRLVLGMLLLVNIACGQRPDDDSMDREVFIATYVDLRIAAAETDGLRLSDAGREEVLTRHGISAVELSYFVEAHAEDLDFMRELWNEVEFRLDREPEAN